MVWWCSLFSGLGVCDPLHHSFCWSSLFEGLPAAAKSGKEARGEEEAHWHSISALSFSCCWRRIRDTICRKSRLKGKCDVWGGQHTMWSWAQSSALFFVCPKILPCGSLCHLCADDSQVSFGTLHPCVLLPLSIPLQFVKGRSSLACSERLLSFLSTSALLSFFFLGKCPLQSFSYSGQTSGLYLSLPSFSHISHPVKPQILSAILSQYVQNLTTFHHHMSTLVQTASIFLYCYNRSLLLPLFCQASSPHTI